MPPVRTAMHLVRFLQQLVRMQPGYQSAHVRVWVCVWLAVYLCITQWCYIGLARSSGDA